MCTRTILFICSVLLVSSSVMAAFGGKPPLGPKDALRHELKPYDLAKLNYLGMNYCENLLDMRVNTPSYTHLGFDSSTSDAWHLHFPDDAGRLMEGIAWEDQFSPVVRLELMRRMVKGMLAAHVPGTKGYVSFRHRSGGKTYVVTDDEKTARHGDYVIANLGDSVETHLAVGIRANMLDTWFTTGGLDRFNETEELTKLSGARSPEYWNDSPILLRRYLRNDACSMAFAARYWMSDENMPLEFSFANSTAQHTQLTIGRRDKGMPFMGDTKIAGTLHLPDGQTFTSDKDGDKTWDDPKFSYLILTKPTAFASPGYSTALLVIWDGTAEKIEAPAVNGYGEIRVQYAGPEGRVWVYPVQWVNTADMEYLHLNARSFLKDGKLMTNGYPPQQLANAAAAGMAAGAYLLSKYDDPLAVTARINAEIAVDQLFDAEKNGMKLVRVFFPLKAAAWMVKTGKATGDQKMVDKYVPLVEQAMKRMTTELGYDGKGWTSGWDHFNAIKAAWLAYDATGKKEYLDVYDKALAVYTIDSKGIYRDGKALTAPGGFDTYAGALALGAWGNAAKLDWVDTLINLDVPNGWHDPKAPLKDVWNDAGAGPWAQDDANPEYVGYSLRGLNIPQKSKHVLPLGAFPTYDATGKVETTNQPMVDNPFFPAGKDKLAIVPEGEKPAKPKVTKLTMKPASAEEKAHIQAPVGSVTPEHRVLSPGDAVVYKFDTKGLQGAGFDALVKGRGFRIDASPDGKRWYQRLLTWSEKPTMQSVDLSAFTGGHDELLKLTQITPADDKAYLQAGGQSYLERGNARYAASGDGFVYRIAVPDANECWLEMILGNGYKVQCSSDGKNWRDAISYTDIKAKAEPNAGWIRMLDVTKYLGTAKVVYVKVADSGSPSVFSGQKAFLRRITVYGTFNSGSVFVRLANTSITGDATVVDSAAFRSWK